MPRRQRASISHALEPGSLCQECTVSSESTKEITSHSLASLSRLSRHLSPFPSACPLLLRRKKKKKNSSALLARRDASPGVKGWNDAQASALCLGHWSGGLPLPTASQSHPAKQRHLALRKKRSSPSPECRVFIPARPSEGPSRSCSRPSMKVQFVIPPSPEERFLFGLGSSPSHSSR